MTVNLISTTMQSILEAHKLILESYPDAKPDKICLEAYGYDDSMEYQLEFYNQKLNDNYDLEMTEYHERVKAYQDYEHKLQMVRSDKYRAEYDSRIARREWKELNLKNRLLRQASEEKS